MEGKKISILQNPLMWSAAISGVLSEVASVYSFDAATMRIINVTIPPTSIALSYTLAWIIARFQTLSFAEQQALLRLKAREKRIWEDLEAGGMSPRTRKKLEKELDDIIWEKSQIGKAGSIVSESDN